MTDWERTFHLVKPTMFELFRPDTGVRGVLQQLLHEHVLKNLEQMRRHQEASNVGEGYDTLVLGLGINRLLSFRQDTAAAVVDAFQHEALSGRRWKALLLSRCNLDDSLHRILKEFTKGGHFPRWEISEMHEPDSYGVLLEQYCRDNPTLIHLQVCGSVFGGILHRSVGTQLRHILDTMSPSRGTTQLRSLKMRSFVMHPECVGEISNGLKHNDSLDSLSLNMIDYTTGFPAALLAPLEGHANLGSLDLNYNIFPSRTLFSLAMVMKNPSCRIRILNLSMARSCEVNEVDGLVVLDERLRTGLVVDALTGCQSLRKVVLSSNLEPSTQSRLLSLVDVCPVLREINLSDGSSIRHPFWDLTGRSNEGDGNANYNGQTAIFESRKSLYRLILEDNPILNVSAMDSISPHDKDVQQLLVCYPALGEINRLDTWHNLKPYVSFSLRTNQLLAFNYAGRGQLNRDIPQALWPSVLQRVHRGARNGLFFFTWDDDTQFTKYVVSCHASIVFCLLKQHPWWVTLEACHANASSPTDLTASVIEGKQSR